MKKKIVSIILIISFIFAFSSIAVFAEDDNIFYIYDNNGDILGTFDYSDLSYKPDNMYFVLDISDGAYSLIICSIDFSNVSGYGLPLVFNYYLSLDIGSNFNEFPVFDVNTLSGTPLNTDNRYIVSFYYVEEVFGESYDVDFSQIYNDYNDYFSFSPFFIPYYFYFLNNFNSFIPIMDNLPHFEDLYDSNINYDAFDYYFIIGSCDITEDIVINKSPKENSYFLNNYDNSVIGTDFLYPGKCEFYFTEDDNENLIFNYLNTSFSHPQFTIDQADLYKGFTINDINSTVYDFSVVTTFINLPYYFNFTDTFIGYINTLSDIKFTNEDYFVYIVPFDNSVGGGFIKDSISQNKDIDNTMDSLDNKLNELDGLINDMNSLEKPTFNADDVKLSDNDISEIQNFSSLFAPVMADDGIVVKMLLIVLTFTFVSYVLFGKRG